MRQHMLSKKQNLIVGLDIGTSKVVVMVGVAHPDDSIEIIGLGQSISQGLKRGMIVHIDATVNSIHAAIEQVESELGMPIHTVYTGIAGNHIRSFNSHGIVAIRGQEVSAIDVEKVLDAARAVAIPADQRILHVLPQEYIIDHQEGIKEPLGMAGVRLEAKVHMVTGAVSAAQNIVKCIGSCDLEVIDIILEPLASSMAVLTEDEKDLGVCLIDIGGGTTDIALFSQGAIQHTAIVPIAGDQVTNDIAVAFSIPTAQAEDLKLKFGYAKSQDISSEAELEKCPVDKKFLSQIMQARYEEILKLVQHELHYSGFEKKIPSGIVLTGGAAKVAGILELGEKIFKMPVRIGQPAIVKGNADIIHNPAYATCIGLLLYGQQRMEQGSHTAGLSQNFKSLLNRMKAWFQQNF